jgi:hypothetical protein
MTYQRHDVTVAGNDAGNQHVAIRLDAIEDDVAADGKAAQTRKQILVAAAAQMRMAGEQNEPFSERIDETVGNVRIATLCGDEVPDVVQIRFSFGCKTMRHSPLASLLGGKTGAAPLLYLAGQLAHGGL